MGYEFLENGLTEIGNLLGLQGRFTVEFGFDQIRREIEALQKPQNDTVEMGREDLRFVHNVLDLTLSDLNCKLAIKRINKQEQSSLEAQQKSVYEHSMKLIKEALK